RSSFLADQHVVQSGVFQHFAFAVHHTHGIRRNLVDDHDVAIHKANFDFHVDQGDSLGGQVFFDDTAHATGELFCLVQVCPGQQAKGYDRIIIDQRITAFVVLDRDLDE